MKKLKVILVAFFVLSFFSLSWGKVTGPPAEGFGPLIDTTAFKVKWMDVVYSDKSKTQKLDIYLPEGKGPFPLLVAVHGGAWEMGARPGLTGSLR